MAAQPGIVSVAGILAEACMIVLIGWFTNRKPSYSGAIANGILVLIAGGNLLFYQKPLGFLLLLYGAFVMLSGMKEMEMKILKGGGDWMGYVVKIFGNYVITAVIVIIIALYSFGVWPFS